MSNNKNAKPDEKFVTKLSKVHSKMNIKEKTDKLLSTYNTGLTNAFKVLKLSERMKRGQFKSKTVYTDKKIRKLVKRTLSHEEIRCINNKNKTLNVDKKPQADPFSGEKLTKMDKLHYYYLYNPEPKEASDTQNEVDAEIQKAVTAYAKSSTEAKSNLKDPSMNKWVSSD